MKPKKKKPLTLRLELDGLRLIGCVVFFIVLALLKQHWLFGFEPTADYLRFYVIAALGCSLKLVADDQEEDKP